jgi:outer membrane receptor protein involved in Fe transport
MNRVSAAVAILSLLALTTAYAQEPAPLEPLPTIPVEVVEPEEPLPRRERAEPVELETVIVTGELLARESDQTTSSVAVHTGAEIQRGTARDVYDVIRATPNASLEDNDYGFGGITLRGIGSYGASGAGAYASYGTTSVVVFDGVGLPRSALSYADLSAFDLANVEIFRGPQSTSQGRNAMAGAVVVNSVAPEPMPGFFPQLRGRLAGGERNSHQYAGAAEATLWPDALALRAVHDDRADDGDVFNATRGEDDAARRQSRSTRVRARWQPGGEDGRYVALLGLAELQRYQGSSYVHLSHEQDRIALNDAPQDYDNHARLYSLDQRLRLVEGWGLRAVSAWFRSDTYSRFDTDYGASDDGATQQWEDARGFSQELRLDYAGERLRGSFGAYWFDESNGDAQLGYLDINAALAIAGLCGIEIVCSLPLGNILFDSASPTKVEDLALFGELDWSVTGRLTLTAGLRADREENSRVISTVTRGDSPTADLAVTLLRGAGALPADGDTPVAREFSEVLPKLAARYELFAGWFVGAAYAEGYRPGGDGYNQISGRHFSFDAERTRNVEVSLKGRHTPWRLSAALNLFHTRWDDMQVQGGEGVDNYMENAGRSTIRGGELELRWRPLGRLQLVGGYGITHGRFDEYTSLEGEDFSGNRLPKAPEYSGVLALEWTPVHGLLIRPDVQWAGSTPANADNRPEHELPGYQLINLSVRWQIGSFALFFAGTNLTDEHYRKDANDYGSAGIDVVSLGEQRRLLGGLEFQFYK